jgi:hypothetical protein
MATPVEWFPQVMADFAGTPAAGADVRLIDFDPARRDALAHLIPDIETWVDPHDPAAHRLLLKVADNVRSFDELAGDPEELAVAVASTLQEFVMDETGSPWPQVSAGERRVVLEPRLDPDGKPRWEARGVHHCSFGHLAELVNP